MTAPIRIRTSSGEVIDLAEIRKYIEFVRSGERLEMRTPSRIEHFSAVLDALEAALGVPELTLNPTVHPNSAGRIPNAETHNVLIAERNRTIREIRQAVGVIEEGET